MAIQGLCGFEQGATGEFASITGTPSIQTAIIRSGAYAMRVNAPGTATYGAFQSRPAGGTLAANFRSVSFYVYVNSRSAGNINCWSIGSSGGAHTVYLRLNNDGTASIISAGGAATSTDVIPLKTWTRVVVGINGSANLPYLAIGGTTCFSSGLQTATAAQVEMRIGQGCVSGESTDWDVVFDDVRWYDNSLTADVGEYKQVQSIPTAGNNAASWTDGAGGTGDIHGSVDNIPPVGVAASTAAAKIKNAASGSNLDYVATMQSYTVAGVPVGSTVNAVCAVCNDAEEVTTGTKAGGLWIASNPAQSASTTTFDYGDDTGTAAGTYPTGWATHLGVVSTAPSVTLTTAPTVTVRKVGSTTRVVDVDFMGLYVDFTPPPIGNVYDETVPAVQDDSFLW